VHLGAVVGGVVEHVDADGRCVSVATEEGEVLEFVLDRATASFTRPGGQAATRLRFLDE